ncbi:hypothetical protein EDB19DRAFT_1832135 [Suillus lakei]|nr:hypothetical protein EDB19DRAFT_1837639 [Suillus lakei]KAG1730050.1 hypothetical protein EDB19DRAFT_1832135 [Suillus lakei]
MSGVEQILGSQWIGCAGLRRNEYEHRTVPAGYSPLHKFVKMEFFKISPNGVVAVPASSHLAPKICSTSIRYDNTYYSLSTVHWAFSGIEAWGRQTLVKKDEELRISVLRYIGFPKRPKFFISLCSSSGC